jgi:hypothetical protein
MTISIACKRFTENKWHENENCKIAACYSPLQKPSCCQVKTFKKVNIYTKYTLRLYLNCNTATCFIPLQKRHTSMKITFYMHVYLFQNFTLQTDVGSVVNWNVLLFCSKVNSCVRKSVYLSTFNIPLLLKSYVGTSTSMVNVYAPPASSCILIYIIWSLWEGEIRQIMRVFVPKRVDLLRGWGRPF